MTILGKIFRIIGSLFKSLSSELKKLVPIAIGVVQAVKVVMENPTTDFILRIIKIAIPGDSDNKIIDFVTNKLKEELPKILVALSLSEAIANIEDPEEQVKAVLEKFKFSSDVQKDTFYHNLAFQVMEALADGKLTWSESITLSEYYYKGIVKVE